MQSTSMSSEPVEFSKCIEKHNIQLKHNMQLVSITPSSSNKFHLSKQTYIIYYKRIRLLWGPGLLNHAGDRQDDGVWFQTSTWCCCTTTTECGRSCHSILYLYKLCEVYGFLDHPLQFSPSNCSYLASSTERNTLNYLRFTAVKRARSSHWQSDNVTINYYLSQVKLS